MGMSIGPIPWDKIVRYGERHGLDNDMMPVFERVIRTLDGEYLSNHSAKEKAKTSSAKVASNVRNK